MFEIYRETSFGRTHHVIYFTELDEHNREREINQALRGENIFDGYLRNYRKDEAKRAVAKVLERLNAGEVLSRNDIARELKPFMD